MRIQHNIMAMNAYRNYNNNTSALSKNLEKLSSGYKINRAGDDAAGLAISEKMRAQITGLETAQKNAKDGISLVQTAEGALTEVHDMLNRMVELANQSANGTYDNEVDRANLQKEVDQLREEIDRIADSANFNGINLLDGTMAGKAPTGSVQDITTTSTFTAAIENAVKGEFTLDLSELKITNTSNKAQTVTITIGAWSTTISVAANSSLEGDKLAAELVKKFTGTGTSFVKSDTAATFAVSQVGDKLVFKMGLDPVMGGDEADYETAFDVTIKGAANHMKVNKGENLKTTNITAAVMPTLGQMAQANFKLTSDLVTDGAAITIGKETYVFAVGKDSKYANMRNAIDLSWLTQEAGYLDTNGKLTEDGLKLAAKGLTQAAKNNKEVIVGAGGTDGDEIHLTSKNALDQSQYEGMNLNTTAAGDASWGNFVQWSDASATMSGGLTLQIGDTADAFNQLRVSIDDMHTQSLNLDLISIADQTSAQSAVDVIKEAINKVSSVRGTLGATQNRLDHTINNLSVMTENIQDAESTIRDTDVADEMMAYTKNNILVQSAQAMLAQANQVPQGVLQLLQ